MAASIKFSLGELCKLAKKAIWLLDLHEKQEGYLFVHMDFQIPIYLQIKATFSLQSIIFFSTTRLLARQNIIMNNFPSLCFS